MSNFVAVSFFKQPSGQIWLESDLGFCRWHGDSVPSKYDYVSADLIADLYLDRSKWQFDQPFESVRLNAYDPLVVEVIAGMKYGPIEITLTVCAISALAALACLFNVGV